MKKKLIRGISLDREKVRKIWMTMRLIVFLFFVSLIHVSASVYSQKTKLNIRVENASLQQVFKVLQDQSEFDFFYKNEQIPADARVSIQYQNESIEVILDKILSGTGLTYHVLDKDIVISAKGAAKGEIKGQQPKSVSGKVTDSSGMPMPGVSVVVKGTTNGIITDANGNYSLSNVPENATLQFSFVGMKGQEVAVADKSTVNITLTEDAIGIEEVVAIGYGVTKKSDLTGSVVSIDSKSLERQTATNVTELLRSALPGLNVGTSTSASGISGLEVRGPNSLGTSNSPLIVVDDVIYQGSIGNINPNDIASVDVLKDASAAAIYGSKSAAGVIIITTKKGTDVKPTINLRSTVGFAHANKIEEVYSPEGYLKLREDVLDRFNLNNPAGYYSNPVNLPADVTLDQWLGYDNLQGTSTPPEDIWLGRLQLQQIEVDNYKAGNTLDWKDIMFQTGLRTDNNISLSGKTNSLSYYTSLGHVSNEGISIYQKYQSFRARINLEATVNKFLSVGVNLQGNENTEPTGVPGAVGLYERNSPYGSLNYDDGTYRHKPHNDLMGDNPYLYEYLDNHYKVREVFANIFGKITLPFGFSYKVNWVNRYAFSQNYRFTPSIYTQGDGGDTGSRSEGTTYSWMLDNILKWNKTIADIHDFDLTFLYNVEEYSGWNSTQSNANFDPNESLSYHNLSIGANPQIGSNDERSTGDALMGRLNYSLLDKYLFTVSVRRDGYSAFGQKNPRATFPALAFGWRLSEEDFINADWLTNLKLRLSYGENGNREIGRYSALSRMNTTKYIYDHSSVTGIFTTNLANKELKWERTSAYNVGLDYAILDGKVSGTMDVYHTSTTDLLLPRSLPNITGYASVMANLGEVQNQGLELSINTINVNKANFTWNSSLSFWFNRNEIKHLYGDMVDVVDGDGNVIGQREEDDIQNGWYIGHAIDEIFDYKILGIWQLGEEEAAKKFGRAPGDIKILDVNEDGVLNFDDRLFQGYTRPRYRISLRNDFTLFRDFDVSFLINSFLDYYGANNNHYNYETALERINKIKTPYWTAENPTNEWGRLYSVNSNPAADWWESKSFVRLQNFTIGYNVPKNKLQKLDIGSLRIFGNIQNLPAISGWQYNWDVETSSPTPMIYTFGIDLSL